MKTLENNRKTKAVRIRQNGDSTSFIASFFQIYQGEESIIQAKSFASEKNAEKWAMKVLAD
jgi:hypothetical protein